jgi:Phosphoesterase family
MDAARFVGRVGGLAVALGVGAAVFTGNGVAWADTASPGPSAAPKGTSSHGDVVDAHRAHASAAVQRPASTPAAHLHAQTATAALRMLAGAQTPAQPVAPLDSPATSLSLAFARREFLGRPKAFASKAAEATVTPTVAMSPNLLTNPGGEAGDPSLSGYSSVTIPGWTVTGTPTVIRYGSARQLPGLLGSEGVTLPAFFNFPSGKRVPDGGTQFFGGGNVATSTLTQTVDLTAATSEIDSGTLPFTLSGDLGGYLLDPSRAKVTVDFLDANQGWLGSSEIGPVSALGRGLQTGLLARTSTGTVPVGTRSAKVVVTFTDSNPVPGNYNNAYADNVSFSVGAALPAPPPPTPPVSTVGPLDHVFMIYMENHGTTDIVGSPNAPYLNSLINAYGSTSDYYALTHPSDPNYYPILGGSDFGIHYNCAANCFDEPNLADSIEAAGKTWAAYQQGGGGYSTPTDRTPFLAFSDIYNNPARVASHIFDLSQLGTDLESPSTAPNYAWIAADEDSNMEGPIDSVGGILQFALSSLTNHQYNVKAGDQFLQQTMPVIFNSAVWQDPTQKTAIFLTFDEDFNNLSWGFGNQGNHVVMVVIPSPGAVAAGMRGGAFTANDYYNHYSLERTIEDSLGLPPLTDNDAYAPPMNEFWT